MNDWLSWWLVGLAVIVGWIVASISVATIGDGTEDVGIGHAIVGVLILIVYVALWGWLR